METNVTSGRKGGCQTLKIITLTWSSREGSLGEFRQKKEKSCSLFSKWLLLLVKELSKLNFITVIMYIIKKMLITVLRVSYNSSGQRVSGSCSPKRIPHNFYMNRFQCMDFSFSRSHTACEILGEHGPLVRSFYGCTVRPPIEAYVDRQTILETLPHSCAIAVSSVCRTSHISASRESSSKCRTPDR